MQAPSFIDILRGQAGKPEPGSPEELARFERNERQGSGAVVQELNISME